MFLFIVIDLKWREILVEMKWHLDNVGSITTNEKNENDGRADGDNSSTENEITYRVKTGCFRSFFRSCFRRAKCQGSLVVLAGLCESVTTPALIVGKLIDHCVETSVIPGEDFVSS